MPQGIFSDLVVYRLRDVGFLPSTGFMKELKRLGRAWNADFDIGDSCGLIPDSWVVKGIDTPAPTLVLAEVEDTCQLTEDKLHKLHAMWGRLDGEGWWLEVWIYDRYGARTHVLDEEYWLWLDRFLIDGNGGA